MTIKQDLDKRVVRAKLGLIAFWLIAAIGMFAAERFPIAGALALLGFAGFFASVVYVIWWVKCPRCKMRLGNAAVVTQGWFSTRSQLNYCYNCGANFNQSA